MPGGHSVPVLPSIWVLRVTVLDQIRVEDDFVVLSEELQGSVERCVQDRKVCVDPSSGVLWTELARQSQSRVS